LIVPMQDVEHRRLPKPAEPEPNRAWAHDTLGRPGKFFG
jgi:hypothetical protein